MTENEFILLQKIKWFLSIGQFLKALDVVNSSERLSGCQLEFHLTVMLKRHEFDDDVLDALICQDKSVLSLREISYQDKQKQLIKDRLIDALRLEEKKLENRKREEIDKLRIEKRNDYLTKIRNQFASSFLVADAIFNNSSLGEISQSEYEEEKTSFIKLWVSGHSSKNKTSKIYTLDASQASAIAA